jgi:hypothetical protein
MRAVRLNHDGGVAQPMLGLACGAHRAHAHRVERVGMVARWHGRHWLAGGREVAGAAMKCSVPLGVPANLHLKLGALAQRHGDSEVGGAVVAAVVKPSYGLRW